MAFIDMEMTGLDVIDHEIIEIGCVLTTPDFKVIEEFELKVKPEHLETADPTSMKINHYQEELWQDALSLKEAMKIFSEKVKAVLETESWIIVGNYHSVQKVILKDADTIIWFDYSRFVVWKRALTRTLKRALFREPCCNGNYESFKLSFFSKDSILLWVYQDYPRKKKRYEEMVNSKHFKSKTYKRIRHPREAVSFLNSVRI